MAKVTSQTLLLALRAHGGSNREIAEDAGISFRAIAEARNGIDVKELQQARKRFGVVASITRLAVYLNVEASTVLDELGIDPTDPSIQRQIERAKEASSLRTHHGDDYVFQGIAARQLVDSKRKGPLVGIVPWSPFSDRHEGGESVARLLLRSVLGSLDAEWDRESNVTLEESFGEAERRLLDDEPGTPECLIGLYDLPWRRRGDVDIVPLPGLYVRVGALCSREIRWQDILAGWCQELPHALVITGDVGDKLLSGPVDYPQARLIVPALATNSPLVIAETVRSHLQRQWPNGFLLVADGPVVSTVHSLLDGMGLSMLEVRNKEWAPACQFGFATRAGAPRFTALLKEAVSQDLLGRVFPRTVYLYFKLLKGDRTGQIRLNLAEMKSPFHPDGPLKFLQIAQELDPDNWETILDGAVMDGYELKEIKRRLKKEDGAK
jgi:hypothetical protein